MNHFRSCSLGFVALLMSFAAVHGEDHNKPRTDLHGDLLPPGAVMRLGSNRLRHPRNRRVALAFSKDGKHLISCGSYEVRVWDAATGRLVRRTRLAWKPREGDWHAHVALTPDGTTAAVWDSEGMTRCLYDTATGQERGRLTSASVLAFSPDSKKMAVRCWNKEEPGSVQLWDIAEFKKKQDLDIPPRLGLRRTAFTPEGKRLAALGEYGRELFVWDAITGKLRQRKKFLSPMASLAYAPDGATLAVGCGGRDEVVLFDADTLKEKTLLRARTNSEEAGCILQLAFSPDGRRLAGFSGEHVAVGYAECGLVLWDLREPTRPRRLFTRSEISDGNSAFVFTPDGNKLAYCDLESDVIDLWDMASGQRLRQPPGHDTDVQTLAVSPDGKILASSDSRPALLLWDTAAGKLRHSLAGPDHGASTCLFSADGKRMISASERGKFQVWEAATGKELRHFDLRSPVPGITRPNTVESIALSGDGRRLTAVVKCLLATSDSHVLPVLSTWDAATGKQMNQRSLAIRARLRDRSIQARSYSWRARLTPDAESLLEWRSDRLILEDVLRKRVLAMLPRGIGDPRIFSADGRLLAAVSFQAEKESSARIEVKGLSLIETISGQEIACLKIGKFDHVAFSPDSHAVVVADRQRLSVWDTTTGERLHQMTWPESVRDGRGEAKISSLAALPGGRAATGTTEGDIPVWDLAPSTWPLRRPARQLSSEQLDALWSDLARDASTAYRAVSLLAAAPARSVALLGARLHAVAVDGKYIEKLLTDLDDERYEIRESASRELTRLRYHAEPILWRARQGKPTLETRRRIDAILAAPRQPPAETLRTHRALVVLERIGTPEARRILENLAGGAESPETRDAQAALQRLRQREDSAKEKSSP